MVLMGGVGCQLSTKCLSCLFTHCQLQVKETEKFEENMMDMTKKQEKLLKEAVEVSGCGVMDRIGV